MKYCRMPYDLYRALLVLVAGFVALLLPLYMAGG